MKQPLESKYMYKVLILGCKCISQGTKKMLLHVVAFLALLDFVSRAHGHVGALSVCRPSSIHPYVDWILSESVGRISVKF